MPVYRTPDDRFADLPGFPFEPHYVEINGMRIHYVDEGEGETVLCLHGEPTWSYLYRKVIPPLAAQHRVVAMDFVGFGRSDKPTEIDDYTYARHVQWMSAWIEQLDVRRINLFCQDWGGLIGLRMVAENPERFDRVVAANTGLPNPTEISQERIDAVKTFRRDAPTPTMQEVMQALGSPDRKHPERTFAYWQKWTWETEDPPIGMLIAGSVDGRELTPGEIAAYDAPFPDPSYKMGPRAMPSQVPTLPDDPSVPANQRAWDALGKWEKPFLCAFSDNDPVMKGGDRQFRERVPGAKDQPHATLEGGGHFLQEGRGDALAKVIVDFTAST